MKNNFEIKSKKIGKKAQVTIFIIIAILIVASVVTIFLFKDKILQKGMPREILPVYNYFLSCIEDETKIAASLMGSQAGYLEVPEFEAGSEYFPSSSHLDFLGFAVPYWYYVSGNGIAKEQIPSKEKMQQQLETYLEERIKECSFENFEAQGFVVEREEAETAVEIKNREIKVKVEMSLSISFGETTARQTTHEVSVNSRLGKFYNIAKKIYDKEKAEMFLENYAVDVLRLYAPVDGVEMTCSPKVWLKQNIKTDLKDALQANVQAIKIKGNYYLATKENKYFVQDIGENVGGEGEYVNFFYSDEWPTKIEIYPDENPLIAEPVGLQEGLGILGFCYVPYHFVYDISYPVIIQIYDAEETFQFPVAIIIDKNKPREALDVEALPDVVPELCENKLTEIEVYTYNSRLEPIEADISFKCFDTACDIGKTKLTEDGEAYLTALFPQCVNGYIITKAENYDTKKYLISTVTSTTANVVLDRLYALNLEIELNNQPLDKEKAIVYFQDMKGEKSFAIAYPEQNKVELSEGEYEVKVYVYKNSTISLEGSTTRKCVDVPREGIFGIFGATKEKCFDIEVPSQTISFAVAGGGKTKYYAVESELEAGKNLVIKASSLPFPSSLEQLQDNYALLEEKTIWVEIS